MGSGRRLKSQERRKQIVDVALNAVAEYGVRGTTLTRIAQGVGVTTPALYAHFANRREILLAALDVLFDRIRAVDRYSSQEDALERLREIGLYHSSLVGAAQDGFVFPLFEFIAAPLEEGLREAIGVRQIERVKELAAIVRLGQEQGTIIKEADPDQVAWMIVGRAWTEDVAHLMGVTEHWNEERSNKMLELILGSIATLEGTRPPQNQASLAHLS
jgi:AcrR family transcriptional regulator